MCVKLNVLWKQGEVGLPGDLGELGELGLKVRRCVLV